MTTTVVVDSGHVNTRCCRERGGKIEVTIHAVYKFVIDQLPLPPNPHRPRRPTDTGFVQTTGTGLKTPCAPDSKGPLRVLLDVTRAVGKVRGNGDLEDSTTLVAKGVVTPWARLRLAIGAAGDSKLRVTHRVLLNDTNIDFRNAEPLREAARGAYEVLVIDFPIWAMRFPERATNGGTPAPRANEILITSVDHTGKTLCAEVDWAELSFGALAPIIMVHGTDKATTIWAGSSGKAK
jgi:hypothetical protein